MFGFAHCAARGCRHARTEDPGVDALQPKPDDHLHQAGDVAIKLLGGFAATRGGEPVDPSAWRLRKGRELVKLLALAPGHRLHREQLMDALWPDLDPAAAANNLHQVVHVARRALGAEAIELRDELLTLRASVDVDDFERAAERARRGRIGGGLPRGAVALRRGAAAGEPLRRLGRRRGARRSRSCATSSRRRLRRRAMRTRRAAVGSAATGELVRRARSRARASCWRSSSAHDC